jgi:hypothetical protein
LCGRSYHPHYTAVRAKGVACIRGSPPCVCPLPKRELTARRAPKDAGELVEEASYYALRLGGSISALARFSLGGFTSIASDSSSTTYSYLVRGGTSYERPIYKCYICHIQELCMCRCVVWVT